MAIAMARGNMRWSPTGLVSCCKERGFVLRTKESRVGASSKMSSWLLCTGKQECKEHSNLRVSAKGWGTADLGISSASWTR